MNFKDTSRNRVGSTPVPTETNVEAGGHPADATGEARRLLIRSLTVGMGSFPSPDALAERLIQVAAALASWTRFGRSGTKIELHGCAAKILSLVDECQGNRAELVRLVGELIENFAREDAQYAHDPMTAESRNSMYALLCNRRAATRRFGSSIEADLQERIRRFYSPPDVMVFSVYDQDRTLGGSLGALQRWAWEDMAKASGFEVDDLGIFDPAAPLTDDWPDKPFPKLCLDVSRAIGELADRRMEGIHRRADLRLVRDLCRVRSKVNLAAVIAQSTADLDGASVQELRMLSAELGVLVERLAWDEDPQVARLNVPAPPPSGDVAESATCTREADGVIVIRRGAVFRYLRGPSQTRLFLAVAACPYRSLSWEEIANGWNPTGCPEESWRAPPSARSMQRYAREIRDRLGPLAGHWSSNVDGAVWRPVLD